MPPVHRAIRRPPMGNSRMSSSFSPVKRSRILRLVALLVVVVLFLSYFTSAFRDILTRASTATRLESPPPPPPFLFKVPPSLVVPVLKDNTIRSRLDPTTPSNDAEQQEEEEEEEEEGPLSEADKEMLKDLENEDEKKEMTNDDDDDDDDDENEDDKEEEEEDTPVVQRNLQQQPPPPPPPAVVEPVGDVMSSNELADDDDDEESTEEEVNSEDVGHHIVDPDAHHINVDEDEEDDDEEEEEEEEVRHELQPLPRYSSEFLEAQGFGHLLFAYKVIVPHVTIRTQPSPIGALVHNKNGVVGKMKGSVVLGDIVVGYKLSKQFGLWLKLGPHTWIPIVKKETTLGGFHPLMKQVRKISLPNNLRRYWKMKKRDCSRQRLKASREACEEKMAIREGVLLLMRRTKLMTPEMDPDLHPRV